jgi:hypothetical protein
MKVREESRGDCMQRRIALWALAGFAVALLWFTFGLFTWPNYNLGRSVFVAITAPASLLGRSMPVDYYWFLLLNTAAYALAGLTTELLHVSVVRHRPS